MLWELQCLYPSLHLTSFPAVVDECWVCKAPFIVFQSYNYDCVLVPSVNGEQENRVQKGNGYFQVPPHTPVIFGEAGGRTLFR